MMAWCKALARIEGREKGGGTATEIMRTGLSACIISLRLVNVIPMSIHDWINRNDKGRSVKLDTPNQNIRRQELLESLRCRFETAM